MKIFDAIKAEDVETLQAMIAANPNCLNITDVRGFTPLIMATYMEHCVSPKYFLRKI